jgi:hypothetical protein
MAPNITNVFVKKHHETHGERLNRPDYQCRHIVGFYDLDSTDSEAKINK